MVSVNKFNVPIKLRQKISVRTVAKSIRKIIETEANQYPNTPIRDQSLIAWHSHVNGFTRTWYVCQSVWRKLL